MSKSVFIAATEARSGKSAILLGVMQLLRAHVERVAIFRPVINDPVNEEQDHDINLVLEHFKLDMEYEQTYAYTASEAVRLMSEGMYSVMLENILEKFKELEGKYDFVLCEGSDYLYGDNTTEYEMNTAIASNLGCPVLAVVNGSYKTDQDVVDTAQRVLDAFEAKGLETMGLVINRACPTMDLAVLDSLRKHTERDILVFHISEDTTLGNPTVHDVVKRLDAKVVYGHENLELQVERFVTAAMRIDNFLKYVCKGGLIITPGDRTDVILASIGSLQSSAYDDISGIVLTGGLMPPRTIRKLVEGWTGIPVPILSVKGDTYRITQALQDLHATIDTDSPAKIASAIGLFEAYVDTDELRDRLVKTKSHIMTPLMFEYTLIERAKAFKQHIVFPEGTCKRVLQAVEELDRRDVVHITLLGEPSAIRQQAAAVGVKLNGINLVNPVDSDKFEDYVQRYFEARKHKCIRLEDARDRISDPTYFGTMMVKAGDADGMVSGAVTTTSQTIRPAFEFIKTKPGASIVSSVFLMCLGDRVLAFGDCAVNPSPTARQLAEIALNSAETARIFGLEPRVAMLSYSTGDSGIGEDVRKVQEAIRIARELIKERKLDLLLDGPIQYDAAVDAEVARTKMPDSEVAGRATVLIFPDLNAGNNTYKAVQRAIPGSTAIGPILQGLNKPVNDLSRGCKVRDIVNTVAITAVQAQAEKTIT